MNNMYSVVFQIFAAWIILSQNVASGLSPKAIAPRIIGGQPAFAGQFPFAAHIEVQTTDSRFMCGGTLTANQWVLTAGHCVYNGVLFTIELGAIHLTAEDPGRVVVVTSTYVLHPDFDPLTIQNDIGLLKLRMEVEYTVYLHPIHPLIHEVAEPSTVYVMGYGQISDSGTQVNEDLRYVIASTITNNECRLVYGNQITDNMVCVAGNYNEGTCTGDNGGALAVQNGRTYAVVGVASFVSSEGCESTHPSGYTRTWPYYDWIVNITQITEDDK